MSDPIIAAVIAFCVALVVAGLACFGVVVLAGSAFFLLRRRARATPIAVVDDRDPRAMHNAALAGIGGIVDYEEYDATELFSWKNRDVGDEEDDEYEGEPTEVFTGGWGDDDGNEGHLVD